MNKKNRSRVRGRFLFFIFYKNCEKFFKKSEKLYRKQFTKVKNLNII